MRGEKINFLYDQIVDRTNAIKLKNLTVGMKISIMSDTMFKAMFYSENRIQYSCKFLSYFLNISYDTLLQTLTLNKNELDKFFEMIRDNVLTM